MENFIKDTSAVKAVPSSYIPYTDSDSSIDFEDYDGIQKPVQPIIEEVPEPVGEVEIPETPPQQEAELPRLPPVASPPHLIIQHPLQLESDSETEDDDDSHLPQEPISSPVSTHFVRRTYRVNAGRDYPKYPEPEKL